MRLKMKSLRIFLFLAIFAGSELGASTRGFDPKTDATYWKQHGVSQKRKEQLKFTTAQNRTISLIVPCYYKHAKQLCTLLHMYEQQTLLPDEVVISLSEAHMVEEHIIEQLVNELWAFPVTLIISSQKQYAAQNRNIACSYATGDIFLCQDADDIPSPQRVEIIHYFFSTYNIDHLMHRYKMIKPKDSQVQFPSYCNFHDMPFTNFNSHDLAKQAGRLTNGNIAIARHVFEKIKWTVQPRAEDVPFNKEVYKNFKNCIVIPAILYGYRQFLSSTISTDPEHGNISAQTVPEENSAKIHPVKVITIGT